jgi:hypothetical protein
MATRLFSLVSRIHLPFRVPAGHTARQAAFRSLLQKCRELPVMTSLVTYYVVGSLSVGALLLVVGNVVLIAMFRKKYRQQVSPDDDMPQINKQDTP